MSFDHSLIGAPKSSDHALIFKWSHAANDYNISDFDEEKTQGITKNQFLEVISQIQKIDNYTVNADILTSPQAIKACQFFPILALPIILIFFLMFAPNQNQLPIVGAPLLMGAIIMMTCACIIQKSQIRKKLKKRVQDIQKIFNKYNETLLNPKALNLRIGNLAAWLELTQPLNAIQQGIPFSDNLYDENFVEETNIDIGLDQNREVENPDNSLGQIPMKLTAFVEFPFDIININQPIIPPGFDWPEMTFSQQKSYKPYSVKDQYIMSSMIADQTSPTKDAVTQGKDKLEVFGSGSKSKQSKRKKIFYNHSLHKNVWLERIEGLMSENRQYVLYKAPEVRVTENIGLKIVDDGGDDDDLL